MTTISETGHAKNVSNLDELVSFVTGYGVTYNPTKASIKLTALQALLLSSKTSLKAVNDVYPAYSLAVAAREQAFLPLSKIATRILNALKATDASVQVIDDAKTIIRKIQGSRVTPKKTEAEKQALLAKGKLSKEISTSQMSYDNRLENLDKLINLLANIPEYTPNEAELKIPALKELFSNLSDKNKDVIDTTVPLSNARLYRNNILYKPLTGLVVTASAVKKYIISVFGAISPQYKQISKLAFKTAKL